MDQPNEPMSDTINESHDMLDITTDNSPGPALVSNTSLDLPIMPPLQPLSEPATIYFEKDSLDASEEPRGDSNDSEHEAEGAEKADEADEADEKAEVAEMAGEEDKEIVIQSSEVSEGNRKSEVTFEVDDEHTKQKSADESNLIKLQDIANEILHQSFETAANLSHNQQQLEDKSTVSIMEFTKNYSDDLLMGSGEQRAIINTESGGPDLDDFELPPYNGSSSSGSEQAVTKHSPVKQRKSSSSTATQASSSSYAASASGLAPTDLSAVKNIIISTYSKVSHVFHWKKPIESGIVFAIGLTLITALTFFSIISVVAYSALGVVSASGLIRIYKTSMKALNRSPETPVDHIWDKALNLNVSMSPERMHELVDTSHANLNASLVYFKQVLLVEDKMATLKFFLFLYSLTYIGAWFNGLTLITIIYVSLFTIPVFYEKNKTKIDAYLNLATNQLSSAISIVTGKVTTLAFGSQSGGNSKKQN